MAKTNHRLDSALHSDVIAIKKDGEDIMRIFSKYLTALFLLGVVFTPTGASAVMCGTLQAVYSDLDCAASDATEFCSGVYSSAYAFYSDCLEQWMDIQEAFCCSSCEGTLEMAAENMGLSCDFDSEDSGTDEGYAYIPLNFGLGAGGSIYDIAPGDYPRCYGDRGPYMVFCDCDTYVAENTYPECSPSMSEPDLEGIDEMYLDFETCTINPLTDDGYDSDRRILCVGEKYYGEGLGDNCNICNCGLYGAAMEGTGEADSDWIESGGSHTYYQRSAQFDAITGVGRGCQSSTSYTYSCDAGYYLVGDSRCQQCPSVEGKSGIAVTSQYNRGNSASCTVPADLELTDSIGNKYIYENDCAYTPAN